MAEEIQGGEFPFVICSGLPRTGTMSMKLALNEILKTAVPGRNLETHHGFIFVKKTTANEKC